jgi:uncharacterized membrane protein
MGVRFFFALLGAGLVVVALGAPVLQHVMGFPYGESWYAIVDPICHQFPTRSLWIFDRPFALCARCTAGYAGLAVASVWSLRPSARRRLLWVAVAAFAVAIVEPIVHPRVVDDVSKASRLFFGLLGGGAIGLFFNSLLHPPSHDS